MQPMSDFLLPGWRSTLHISPLKWPLDLHGTLGVHGTLHLIANQDHGPMMGKPPSIILIPGMPQGDRYLSRSWYAHWLNPDAHKLQNQAFNVEIYGALRRLQIGTFEQIKLAMPASGTYLVALRAITPLLKKTEQGHFRSHFSPGDFIGAIHQCLRRFVGNPVWMSKLEMRIDDWQCLPIQQNTGWSGNNVAAFLWSCHAQVNEGGLLAIRIAEQFGLGATISRGYGRFCLKETVGC